MNSTKFSLVPGHNSAFGNYIYLFCHNDGWLLHIRILSCGGYYALLQAYKNLK